MLGKEDEPASMNQLPLGTESHPSLKRLRIGRSVERARRKGEAHRDIKDRKDDE